MTKGGDTMNYTRKGLTLIETQAVPNPMAKGHFFYNMKELLWSDSTITFGCQLCGQQTKSRPEMSIHIGKAHFPKSNKTKKKATRKYTKRNTEYWANGGNIAVAHKPMTDTDLKDKELEFWKSQAHKAWSENRKLRQQLKVLLGIQ